MTNLEFFQSLDYEDGLRTLTETFDRFSLQCGTTLGLDDKPQIRPLTFKFEEDGALYLDTAIFSSVSATRKRQATYGWVVKSISPRTPPL